MALRIRFYRSPAGREPVREYLDGLQGAETEKVAAALLDAAEHGLPGLPATQEPGEAPAAVTVRHVEGKLWELKVSAQRLFYVVVAGPAMVLLHTYKKQGQRAPRGEIETAKAHMKEVLAEQE